MFWPLHNAARNGDLQALTALIGEGVNLELRDAHVGGRAGPGRSVMRAQQGLAPVERAAASPACSHPCWLSPPLRLAAPQRAAHGGLGGTC